MWIRTQNKQRIINSNQIVDIYINNKGTTIIAESVLNGEYATYFELGEYEDRDTCLKVLESVSFVIGSKMPMIMMPLGGEVEDWKKNMADIATAYVVNDFRVK